jgi:hypothetical protein
MLLFGDFDATLDQQGEAVPICYNWMSPKTDNGKLERHERRF